MHPSHTNTAFGVLLSSPLILKPQSCLAGESNADIVMRYNWNKIHPLLVLVFNEKALEAEEERYIYRER